MIHRIRMARKRLMVAREREVKSLVKDCVATDSYITLGPEAPEADVLVALNLMCKAKSAFIRELYALRAIERRKDQLC